MPKPKPEPASKFLEAMQQAADIMRSTRKPARAWPAPAAVDVRAIRARTGLSQTRFAHRFGFTPSAAREWEQGRRHPEAAARVLPLVIASHPDIVEQALAAATQAAA